MNNKEEEVKDDDPDTAEDGWFPWEDVAACRHRQTNYHNEPHPEELVPHTKACPRCGGPVERFYFKSPDFTWRSLCGRAGWMEACFSCKKQIDFRWEVMS